MAIELGLPCLFFPFYCIFFPSRQHYTTFGATYYRHLHLAFAFWGRVTGVECFYGRDEATKDQMKDTSLSGGTKWSEVQEAEFYVATAFNPDDNGGRLYR